MNHFNRISKIVALVLLLTTQAQAKLTVHEWGTFTSLVGSDGEAQHGMYYEDELLPDFVHNFGDPKPKNVWAALPPGHRPQPVPPPPPGDCVGVPKVPCEFLEDQVITQKMETPVVYFYADQPQKVDFKVSFPGGIISQSFPAATTMFPEATPGVTLKNGLAHYEVNILQGSKLSPPAVAAENIYSHARNVASDLIQVGQEVEKFIFYRGLGEFKTKLLTTSKNGNLLVANNSVDKVPAAFLISSLGQGVGSIQALGSFEPGASVTVSAAAIERLQATRGLDFATHAGSTLLKSLTAAGLYQDEAQAMIDTWKNGYFKTPGLRVLYVLGNAEVEEILPLQITPAPEQLTRVFVGRIEILLDSQEELVLNGILKQGAQFDVQQLGRMAYPTLLRVKEVASTKGVMTADLNRTIETLISKIP